MAFLRLKRSQSAVYVDGRTQGFRFKVEVVEAVGVDPNIFVYQRKPIISGTSHEDVFTNVASPADLEEYAVGDVACPTEPFFRLDCIDLVFRNITLAEDAWAAILQDVDQLIETLGFMNDLSSMEEVTFGEAPVSSSSSSSSSVSSSSSSS